MNKKARVVPAFALSAISKAKGWGNVAADDSWLQYLISEADKKRTWFQKVGIRIDIFVDKIFKRSG